MNILVELYNKIKQELKIEFISLSCNAKHKKRINHSPLKGL